MEFGIKQNSSSRLKISKPESAGNSVTRKENLLIQLSIKRHTYQLHINQSHCGQIKFDEHC